MITFIEARTALETPQIVLSWTYEENLPDIDTITIRKSKYRFPESVSEGEAVLSEAADNANLRTSYADTDVDSDTVYYYSVFFTYKGPYSHDLVSAHDVSRLGQLRSVRRISADLYWILARTNEGVLVLYKYDSNKELATFKIDLTNAFGFERIIDIVDITDGATREIELATERKVVKVDIALDAEEALAEDVTSTVEFDEVLTPGHQVVGAARHSTEGLHVVDDANDEVVQLGGTFWDISGIENLGRRGLQIIENFPSPLDYTLVFGNGKSAFSFPNTVATPQYSSGEKNYVVRSTIDAGFDLVLGNSIVTVTEDTGLLEIYDENSINPANPAPIQMEEPFYSDASLGATVFRFNESELPVQDIEESVSATLSGSYALGQVGKFDQAIQVTDIDGKIELGNYFGFELDAFMSFWWATPYQQYLPSVADRILLEAYADANNYVSVILTTDEEIELAVMRAGSLVTDTADASSLDDGIFHHILVVQDTSDTIDLYVDFVQVASVTNVNTNTPSFTVSLGDGSASALGYYDDFAASAPGAAVSLFTRYQLTTAAFRCHALSGREPASFLYNFRDKLLLYLGNFIVDNDYGKTVLSPDTALADGEVINRQDKSFLNLGHLGGMSRLFGLLIDRYVDYRRFFLNHVTSSECEYEFLDDLGITINAVDFDPSWNVDKSRRYLEIVWDCYQRYGTVSAFKLMTRFLGFRVYCDENGDIPVIVARRTFDSETPYDNDTFDSGDADSYLARLLLRFFIQNDSGFCNTSVPVTRTLTDPGASFNSTAEIGSMVKVYDVDNPEDNGEYLITAVNSDTEIVIDRDWPQGSLTGVSYTIHWRIPSEDPYSSDILSRLKKFKACWQRLELD